ncbi:Valyl-tRNA synthetase [Prochlorococcus marinus subsp. pastoris str. CCMP1986]|uniref:Valine--tRNA ligase n=1 Tax=Prochlorococcus marinus subsp. pastoris (strain CCMP1986 / NIES-2087 / MED4) TaxID=59919 RepID=SYV_PROMP|nr:valine--tRNA ligase [Prochlorococcus marinus]Q7UZI3.1 RecName: Full=Valine--tRNA ligase; AltName: Full=Valyl-tRNA synthetase; Short=ValRS [Prochlorococcus marinus subsp. pastoris str. CCMP1986]KGF86929.1 Valyl-tRNA synthetase [Prochlorococcus marinus str. EQPAC1]CAE20141.1 Valyl-tRNA synthetase [Prochlorococcus marinus subsp. pastoris str. CCMP1986]
MNESNDELTLNNYLPSQVEQKWQKRWDSLRAFSPNPSDNGDPFCIVIPPPNVTGSLHMGHAFNTALIDVIIRFQRLLGKNVLCLPGTDHASIAVQTILEKQLKTEGKNSEDIGREEFLKRAWIWKEQSGGKIISQLKRIGYSVDWERERFTLDEKLNEAVVEAFNILHEKKLIYRGEYLVNWCPASQSAVSDLEVEMQEVNGYLWHFKYPLISDQGQILDKYLEVATTRPETLLGDTALAVNPNDERYKKYIDKKVKVPFVDREIPVISDIHVDKDFGTGCVKVTPAHDPNDFAIGKRNNLKQINIMNKDGTLNINAGKFQDLDRFDARKKIIKELDTLGLLTKIENYKNTVPFSDRGKVPIEPLLSTQWFLKMDNISSSCLKELDSKKPTFIPQRWEKVYKDWLDNINDWCISRQLWWGHQIPAWYVLKQSEDSIDQNTPYVVARNEKEALSKATKEFGSNLQLIRDKDVLDTWFSSGLWPFSTLGWPNINDADFKKWYPNSVLITGFDIIFFWVARMTMMGKTFTNNIPFKDVYIHGLVRDENNKKMSKSSGNGIDPLLLIDKYGSDALRFALLREVAGAGQDIRLDYDRKENTSSTVEASRNFANKLWNATKFVLINKTFSENCSLNESDEKNLELSDKWILSKLNQLNTKVSNLLIEYKLGESAKLLYEFAWNDFCDWYVEFAKQKFNNKETHNRKISEKILIKVLTDVLVMMHPFMPHITEELWHKLQIKPEQILLSLQKWPVLEKKYINSQIDKSFHELFEIIRLIRNLRVELGLKPSQLVPVYLISDNVELTNFLKTLIVDIKTFTKSSEVIICKSKDIDKNNFAQSFSGIIGDLEVYLPFNDFVNLEALKDRLTKDLKKVNSDIETLNKRISNKNFIDKAPKEIVDECFAKLKEGNLQSEIINKKLKLLK